MVLPFIAFLRAFTIILRWCYHLQNFGSACFMAWRFCLFSAFCRRATSSSSFCPRGSSLLRTSTWALTILPYRRCSCCRHLVWTGSWLPTIQGTNIWTTPFMRYLVWFGVGARCIRHCVRLLLDLLHTADYAFCRDACHATISAEKDFSTALRALFSAFMQARLVVMISKR